MTVSQLQRAASLLEEINPRRGGFFGLFGGIDWVLVVRIVLEILRRLGYLNPDTSAARLSLSLPYEIRATVDREFPT